MVICTKRTPTLLHSTQNADEKRIPSVWGDGVCVCMCVDGVCVSLCFSPFKDRGGHLYYKGIPFVIHVGWVTNITK